MNSKSSRPLVLMFRGPIMSPCKRRQLRYRILGNSPAHLQRNILSHQIRLLLELDLAISSTSLEPHVALTSHFSAIAILSSTVVFFHPFDALTALAMTLSSSVSLSRGRVRSGSWV